jgi:hypothetical protein
MLKRMLLLALCLLTAVLALQPVMAEDDAEGGIGLIETTPDGWPLPVYLPDWGHLTMVGYEGATREDVTEPFDFEWTADVEAGSGEIGLIQGFYLPGSEGDDPDALWENYDASFSEELAAEDVEVLDRDLDAEYGGRPWLLYNLRHPGVEDSGPIELYTLINFDETGGMTMLNFFADLPVNEDFDGMLSLITGGPEAPQ